MKVDTISYCFVVVFSLAYYYSAASAKSLKNFVDAQNSADWYVFHGDEGLPFCYNETEPCGPSHWGGFCNSGNQGRQSPLDLSHVSTKGGDPQGDTKDPLYHLSLSPGYDDTYEFFAIQNDGHSIQLSLPPSATDHLRITYDPLGEKKYQFFRIHFHWGLSEDRGSEHTLEGTKYAMELHMVHYSLRYNSIEDALDATEDHEALSVIGVFVEVCGDNSTGFAQIQRFVEDVGRVPSQEMTQVMAPFSLGPFLPAGDGSDIPTRPLSHYSYHGSLTTPSCLEVVQWSVLEKPICISRKELETFQNVLTHGGLPLDQNHRPAQELGKRDVVFRQN